MKIITDERCTGYSRYGHPERPERISRTLPRLREQSELPLTWGEPLPVDDAVILRAHTKEMLARLTAGEDFDSDTPFFPGIVDHARRSVGGALAALQSTRSGTPAFSLIRPPGHHATRTTSMGFCYLNSIGVAALHALATGAKRVAVYDFDVHHGNGTEDVLLDVPGAAFFSIHQFPCYPGTGRSDVGKNCFNFPVAPSTPREEYRKILSRALEGVKKFKPDLIAVSAGFDAYAHDPLAQGTLLAEDFHWLGGEIRKLNVTTFSVLEGGYSADLPELILAYLKGWAGI
jgi:acetoin utilization deacetylase AcuC-like enzyme